MKGKEMKKEVMAFNALKHLSSPLERRKKRKERKRKKYNNNNDNKKIRRDNRIEERELLKTLHNLC